MSDADLTARIGELMPRARRDLAELVAFRSVAGSSEFPPEECDRAASWLVDALTDAGLTEVAAHQTADGSKAVLGHRPAPAGAPTVLLYCHYDVVAPLAAEAWETPGLRADRARGRPLVRPRDRRLQGQHRRPPDRAAGARRRAAGRRQGDRRGLRGGGDGRPRGADRRRPGAARRGGDGDRRHRQLRARAADPDDVAARRGEPRPHRAHPPRAAALGGLRRRRPRRAWRR